MARIAGPRRVDDLGVSLEHGDGLEPLACIYESKRDFLWLHRLMRMPGGGEGRLGYAPLILVPSTRSSEVHASTLSRKHTSGNTNYCLKKRVLHLDTHRGGQERLDSQRDDAVRLSTLRPEP
jgi:hypothetical protein